MGTFETMKYNERERHLNGLIKNVLDYCNVSISKAWETANRNEKFTGSWMGNISYKTMLELKSILDLVDDQYSIFDLAIASLKGKKLKLNQAILDL